MTLEELHEWYRQYIAANEEGRRAMAGDHAALVHDMFEEWSNEEVGALAFEVLSTLLVHRDDPVQTLQVMTAIKVLAQHKHTTEYLIGLIEKGSN